MKSRRAVSPILSVIILIGIATVGGGFLFNAQNQFLTSSLAEMEYKITDLRMEKDSSGSCYFLISLYNSGSEAVTTTSINTTLDSGEPWFPKDPGLTKIINPRDTLDVFESFSGDECGNFTSSQSYSIGVEAVSDISKFKTIKIMKVENVTKQ